MTNKQPAIESRKAFFVGGGIGALAGAAFLIRDAKMPGSNIVIYEALDLAGGSMDGAGETKKGFVARGGRMLNFETFECLWNLLKTIPSLNDTKVMVMDEIIEFNNRIQTHARARLVDKDGIKQDVTSMGFNNIDRIQMGRLGITPEEAINGKKINEWFTPAFFESTFWYMWATTFAFQPWHSLIEFKRYNDRFIHEFPRIHTLAGVRRTPLNQYDSIILPLQKWLEAHGVNFIMGTVVTDVEFSDSSDEKTVTALSMTQKGKTVKKEIGADDLVFITNGCMTDGSDLGSMTTPARLNKTGTSFDLWKNIVNKKPDLGNPEVFSDHVDESLWQSFTVTCYKPDFHQWLEKWSGNAPGTGALVTFKDSNWLMSIVCAAQPHFLGQPDDVKIFWGYSLFPTKVGDYVKKPMAECTGEEILTELLYHLHYDQDRDDMMQSSVCIPCMMPFITSHFLARSVSDRPKVVPEGSTNLAFLGQFSEIPGDVVFTVEYSVRSAMMAVYSLLGLPKEVPPIYEGKYDARVLFNSFIALFR